MACETHGLTDPACPSVLALLWLSRIPPCGHLSYLSVWTHVGDVVLCGQTLSLPLGERLGVGPLGFTGSAGLPLTKPQTRFCVHSACTTGNQGAL